MDIEPRRWLPLIGLAALAAVPLIAALTDDPYLVTIFTRVVILALAAASLDFILGYGAMVSLGHAAFLGIGAYTVGILAHHHQSGAPLLEAVPWLTGTNAALISLPLAIAVAALCALLIGALSLRTRALHFIMITLAFAQMFFFLFIAMARYGGGDGMVMWQRNTLPLINTGDSVQFYYLCLAFLAGSVFLLRRIVAARFGRVLRGAAENERRMAALGFPVFRYRLAAFTLAGAIGGLAGALMANLETFVSPSLLHWSQSGELMVMVILGGLGSIYGPVLGATLFIMLEETLAAWTEHWMIILGPILILVVLYARRGLFGWLTWRRHG